MKTLSLRSLSRDAPSLEEAVLITHEKQVIGRYVPISVTIDDRTLAGIRPGEPSSTSSNSAYNTRPFTPAPKPQKKK